MENRISLKKNFIFNLATQIINLIVPLITTPYLARVLHETGNGQYSYAYSIITYFILFANLGFNFYGQREIARTRDDKYQMSKVFWEIFVLRTLCSVISFGILISIVFTVGFGEKYNMLILILSMQVLGSMFDILFYYQGNENFKAISIRTIIIKVLGLVAVFVFVKKENDVWIYALCLSAITVISNFIMWPGVLKKICFIKISSLNLSKHIKPTIMIFLPTLAVTVYSVFDKTMIGLLSSNPDYDNGCYEQAYKINSIGVIFPVLITTILGPRNAYEFQRGNLEAMDRNIKFSIKYVWMLGLPLIAGFAILSPSISSWFLGDGYSEVSLLLQIMSVRFVLSGFSEILSNQLFIVIGKEKYTTIATTVAAIINIGLNFVLIPYFGAVGAAITTSVSEFIVFLILLIIANKSGFIKIRFFIISCIKYLASATIMIILIYFIQSFMDYSLWTFLLISSIGATIYFLALTFLKEEIVLCAINKALVRLRRWLLKNK